MNRLFIPIIPVLLASPAIARATSLGDCKQTHQKSKDACQEAATEAKQTSDAAAQSARSATSGSDGTGQSNMGSQLAGASTTATNAVTAAKGTCTDQKKKCDDACDASKAQNPKEKPQISQEKQKCDSDIDDITKQLDASAGTTKAGTEGGDKTKDAAQGGGGSPSSGGDKSDDKSNDSSTPSTTPATTDTSSTGSSAAALTPANAGTATTSSAAGSCPGTERDYLDENCVGELTARCKGNAGDSQCQLFNQRYCGGSGSGGSSGVLGTSGATLAQGSGLSASDGYCAGRNASAYCTAEKSQCPSCCAQSNSCGGSVTQDCSDDPSRVATAQNAVSTASVGVASAGGGAPGSTLGGADVGLDAAKQTGATPESAESKLLGKMGSAAAGGGGGGGGGGSGGGESSGSSGAVSDFLSGYGIDINRKPGSAMPAVAEMPVLASSIKDVAPDRAADVFKIQSLVLKARCDAGLELNCPPRN